MKQSRELMNKKEMKTNILLWLRRRVYTNPTPCHEYPQLELLGHQDSVIPEDF